jgi:hypothetical protein
VPASDAVTRRRFLTHGALLGGALVWAVPVVEVLSTGRAFAATGSSVTPTPPPDDDELPFTDPGPDDPAGVSDLSDDPTDPDTPAGELAFTGPAVPVRPAVEIAVGLVAVGAALNHLAGRLPQSPAEQSGYGR